MKKTFTLISLLSLFADWSLAQNVASNSNSNNNPSSNSASTTNTNSNNPNSSNTQEQKNQNPSFQKADSNSKTLENSALVDNIQGGMANLLMGNKSVSLMFDDHEVDNINRAVDSFKNNESFAPDGEFTEEGYSPDDKKKKAEEVAAKEKQDQEEFNAKSYIYLASIMYSTPQDWVVWINDKKITSDNNKKNKEIFIRSVERDKVSILWNVSPSKLRVLLGSKADNLNMKTNSDGQIEVKFSLQPNQTFVLGSNMVVEGKSVTNMIKKKSDNSDPINNSDSASENNSRKNKTVIMK